MQAREQFILERRGTALQHEERQFLFAYLLEGPVREADQIPLRRCWQEQALLDLQGQILGQIAVAAAGEERHAAPEQVSAVRHAARGCSRRMHSGADGLGIERRRTLSGRICDRRGQPDRDDIAGDRSCDPQQRAVLRSPGKRDRPAARFANRVETGELVRIDAGLPVGDPADDYDAAPGRRIVQCKARVRREARGEDDENIGGACSRRCDERARMAETRRQTELSLDQMREKLGRSRRAADAGGDERAHRARIKGDRNLQGSRFANQLRSAVDSLAQQRMSLVPRHSGAAFGGS